MGAGARAWNATVRGSPIDLILVELKGKPAEKE
jgi:hypothetical protein